MPINSKAADRLQHSMLSGSGRYKIANALMLKGAWLCCVLGGVTFGLPALLIMFSISLWQKELRHDLPYVLLLGVTGLCLDTVWLHTGVLDYGSAAVMLPLEITLAPAWIVMLWLAVGLSIRHSLIFLVNRPMFGALLVGCGSPVSYWTGERFGAVVIPSMSGLVVLAVVWIGLFFAVFSWAKTRLTAD